MDAGWMVSWMGTIEYILSRFSFQVSSRRAAEPWSLGPPSLCRCRRELELEQDAGFLLTYLLTHLLLYNAQARLHGRMMLR